KLRRGELAERLGHLLGVEGAPGDADAPPGPFVAPRTPLERELAAIWADVLELDRVGVHDDFFALGGDSMLATLIASRVSDATGLAVTLNELFEAPTIAGLAALLDDQPVDAAGDREDLAGLAAALEDSPGS